MGCKFFINQDTAPKKKTFIICNHPSYFDGVPIFWWAFKNGRMNDLMFVGKETITRAPIVGNLITEDRYLLIKRDFDTDKQRIIDYCNKLNESNKPYVFIIFTEGTTYSDCTIKKTKDFSTQNNIEHFKNVLCPRIKGTELILQHLKPDCILDMTLTYNDYKQYYGSNKGIPFSGSKGFLLGQYPMSTTIDVVDITKEMTVENVPMQDKVMNRWRIKDELIEQNLGRDGYNSSDNKMIHFLFLLCIINNFFFKWH